MWTSLKAAAEVTQGMVTTIDVEDVMRASNFKKEIGPYWFDGTILKHWDALHRLNQEITA